MQIGGGVRVGDAFQAIVGPKLIAIWAREICRNFSGEASASRLNKRDTASDESGDSKP